MISSRSLLLVLNTFFFFLGCGVLTIGLWSQYDKNFSILWNSFEISKLIDARGLNGASVLLIVSGFSSIFVSFIGLYGALKQERCFLTTYCLLMCIILILEVSATSVFVSYQNQVRGQLEAGLNKTVQLINTDGDKVAFGVMSTIQPLFKCCGCHGPDDYANATLKATCQTRESKPDAPVYYQTGCYSAIIDYMNNHLPTLLGLAALIIAFQVLCLAISIRACSTIRFEGYEDIN